MTAAKMVLHDWQRGRIPFFVPPPQKDGSSKEEPDVNGVDVNVAVDSNQASAAFKAIASVLSSQQQRSVPVQRDLFSETELKGEAAEEIQNTEEDDAYEDIPTPNSDTSEQYLATDVRSEQLSDDEQVPTTEA